MANQASKKRERGNTTFIFYLRVFLVAINAWFFVYNLLFLKGKYFSWSTAILYIIHALLQGLSYFWIMQNMETMLFSDAITGYGGDIFILSLIVSLFLPFSRKWMWVYIIIPLYLGYLGIRKLLDWVFTPDVTPEEIEENKSRRQKKREERSLKHPKNQ
ncbi:hypothetical protein WA171_003460 [Blastocystis sp. BT1]